MQVGKFLPMQKTCQLVHLSTLLEILVVDHVEAAVGHKHLRHANAFRCLVVLQDGGHDAGQSEC